MGYTHSMFRLCQPSAHPCHLSNVLTLKIYARVLKEFEQLLLVGLVVQLWILPQATHRRGNAASTGLNSEEVWI